MIASRITIIRMRPVLLLALISSIYLIPFSVFSQELITNGGFEETRGEIKEKNPLSSIKGWNNATGVRSDVICKTECNSQISFPGISEGIEPNNGNYSASFSPFSLLNSFYRSYLENELAYELKKNTGYNLSFDIMLHPRSKYALKGIGVLATSRPFEISAKDENIVIENAAANYSIDLGKPGVWVKYSVYFEAEGGEEYITIGNFEEGTFTQYDDVTELVNSDFPIIPAAVYIIDNVSLSEGSKPLAFGKMDGSNLAQNNATKSFIENQATEKLNSNKKKTLEKKELSFKEVDKKAEEQLSAGYEKPASSNRTPENAERINIQNTYQPSTPIAKPERKPVNYRKPGNPEIVNSNMSQSVMADPNTVVYQEYSTQLNDNQYDQVDEILQKFKESKAEQLKLIARTSYNEDAASYTNRILKSLSSNRLRQIKRYILLKGISESKIKTIEEPFNPQKLQGGSPTVSFEF